MKRAILTAVLLPLFLFACATATARPPRPTPVKKAETPVPAEPAPTATPASEAPKSSTKKPAPDLPLYSFERSFGSGGSALNQLQFPEGIDVDADGEIFIADTGNHRILVWDANGKPLRTIGSFGPAAVWRNAPQFNYPTGVLILPLKKLYVADSLNHRIVVIDSRGLVLDSWGERGHSEGQFDRPRDITLDKYNNVWVLDSGNSRIQIFGGPGSFKSQWGSFGKEEGQLKYPLGFALNIIDQCIVADTENYRYQVFNDEGAPVTQFGWFGDGPGQFKEPAGVAVTPSGLIAIVDGVNARVVFLNNRFEPIGSWKVDDRVPAGKEKPQLRGIASDRSGCLYVTDMQNHRILKLKPGKCQAPVDTSRPTPTPDDEGPYGGPGYPVR